MVFAALSIITEDKSRSEAKGKRISSDLAEKDESLNSLKVGET